MDNTRGKWWWLPSALLAVAGILFLVAAVFGNTGVWIAIGIVFLALAGMNFQRRRGMVG